jgi:hypothetical protein
MVVAPGQMIDSFLSIPGAESLPLYRMVLKLACVCSNAILNLEQMPGKWDVMQNAMAKDRRERAVQIVSASGLLLLIGACPRLVPHAHGGVSAVKRTSMHCHAGARCPSASQQALGARRRCRAARHERPSAPLHPAIDAGRLYHLSVLWAATTPPLLAPHSASDELFPLIMPLVSLLCLPLSLSPFPSLHLSLLPSLPLSFSSSLRMGQYYLD